MKCFWVFFHNWLKWENYDFLTTYFGKTVGKEVRQSRECKDCGRKQDRLVVKIIV